MDWDAANDWQGVIYASQLRAAQASRTGLSKFSEQWPQEYGQQAAKKVSATIDNAGMWSTVMSWVHTLIYFLGLWICVPAFAAILWITMRRMRPERRQELLELFNLPREATGPAIFWEIVDCTIIRVGQFLWYIVVVPLVFTFDRTAALLSVSKRTAARLSLRFNIWYCNQPVSERITLLRIKAQTICNEIWHRSWTIFWISWLAFIIAMVARALVTTEMLEGTAVWVVDQFRPAEPNPDEFFIARTSPPPVSTLLQQSFVREDPPSSAFVRDVPTAQSVAVGLPVTIPEPTLAMLRPEQFFKPGARTILEGKAKVYCSKCKQWHCCELPY